MNLTSRICLGLYNKNELVSCSMTQHSKQWLQFQESTITRAHRENKVILLLSLAEKYFDISISHF
jgi:hypothetical protein